MLLFTSASLHQTGNNKPMVGTDTVTTFDLATYYKLYSLVFRTTPTVTETSPGLRSVLGAGPVPGLGSVIGLGPKLGGSGLYQGLGPVQGFMSLLLPLLDSSSGKTSLGGQGVRRYRLSKARCKFSYGGSCTWSRSEQLSSILHASQRRCIYFPAAVVLGLVIHGQTCSPDHWLRHTSATHILLE